MNSTDQTPGDQSYQELAIKLEALESRVANLEQAGYPANPDNPEVDNDFAGLNFKLKGSGESDLESSIGEYGLAWLGNIVLFFGISFFIQYLQQRELIYMAILLGFLSVGCIFFLAYYFRSSNPFISKVFNLNGYLLLYYVTMRLHFFTDNPIITTKSTGLVLLFLETVVFFYFSIKNLNRLLIGTSVILVAVTAVLSDSTHVMLSAVTLLSMVSLILLYRIGWIRILFLSIGLVYLTYLVWMFGNPLMGNKMGLVSDHQSGYVYFFIVAAIFSLVALLPKNENLYKGNSIIGAIVFNGTGFTFVCSLFILSFFKNDFILLTGSIAVYCLIYSIILQIRSAWKITAALYALFGFVTLSVTFYGIYGFPRAYFLLALQSLLVVSMAIWFRSRFIVIMNSLLFILLLLIYLATAEQGNLMNISFSIVALMTARILNWKKERLTIRTDVIRNLYLVIVFGMILFTLYHLVPGEYVVLSWSISAVGYFIFSLILNNVKYRYLSLATMIAAAFYLFIVDLARIELVYRVIALFFLSVISIGLSFYYTKKHRAKTK